MEPSCGLLFTFICSIPGASSDVGELQGDPSLLSGNNHLPLRSTQAWVEEGAYQSQEVTLILLPRAPCFLPSGTLKALKLGRNWQRARSPAGIRLSANNYSATCTQLPVIHKYISLQRREKREKSPTNSMKDRFLFLRGLCFAGSGKILVSSRPFRVVEYPLLQMIPNIFHTNSVRKYKSK